MSRMGLGCVKTQTCCGDENSVLKRRMFFYSRARPTSRRPPMQRRRNIENLAVPTLPVRSSRLALHATMCRTEGDLEACWNRKRTGAERSSPTRRHRHAYGAQQGRQPLRPGVWTRRGLLMFCSVGTFFMFVTVVAALVNAASVPPSPTTTNGAQ
jgi:hypothetical protein